MSDASRAATDLNDASRAATKLRSRALAAWHADPSRLRQDANLEEDFARAQTAARVVTELAQNAADAARAGSEEGRLLLRLARNDGAGPDHAEDDADLANPSHNHASATLLVANTGAPLDEAGLQALAALRASAKTAGVGRFGVGVAATRMISDEMTIASHTKPSGEAGEAPSIFGARFSLADSHELLTAEAPVGTELGEVLGERNGAVPALRLPFDLPVDAGRAIPASFTTAVVLTLRDEAAYEQALHALAAVDDTLLLALPDLARVRIELPAAEPREISDVAARWWLVHDDGQVPAELLAERPVDERHRTTWSLTWALPRQSGTEVPSVLHAPTATSEAVTLPALLIASFPLSPSRQHVPPSGLRDFLVERCATAYARLLTQLAEQSDTPTERARRVLMMVPLGLAASALDAELREAISHQLATTPLLPDGHGTPQVARGSSFLLGPIGEDTAVLAALADFGVQLLLLPASHASHARQLGATGQELAEVIDTVAMDGAGVAAWRRLYDVLQPWAEEHREALATLPVPLIANRMHRGPRATVHTTTPDFPPLPGLRVIEPEAWHPLLEQLGAESLTATELLGRPELQEVLALGDPDATHAVLALVSSALRDDIEELPEWLGELPLPSASGGQAPAGELALPGSWAADVFTGLEIVAEETLQAWGADVLRALGVRDGLLTTTVADVVAEEGADEPSLEGWQEYLADLAEEYGAGTYLGELAVVPDLDAVGEEQLAELLVHIAADPRARAALLTPVAGTEPSYTAWWLRHELGAPFAAAGSRLPFLPPAPAVAERLDPQVQAAIGVVTCGADLDEAGWWDYCEDWPLNTLLHPVEAVTLWQALAEAVRLGVALPAPDVIPAQHGQQLAMFPADDVVVAPPMYCPLQPTLPATDPLAGELAAALDLPGPPRVAAADVTTRGAHEVMTPQIVADLLPDTPGHYVECEELEVAGVTVEWWVHGGEVWATTLSGVARGLAHAAGRWSQRHLVAELLGGTTNTAMLVAEWAGDLPGRGDGELGAPGG